MYVSVNASVDVLSVYFDFRVSLRVSLSACLCVREDSFMSAVLYVLFATRVHLFCEAHVLPR